MTEQIEGELGYAFEIGWYIETALGHRLPLSEWLSPVKGHRVRVTPSTQPGPPWVMVQALPKEAREPQRTPWPVPESGIIAG